MNRTDFKYNPTLINSKKKRVGTEEIVLEPLSIIFPERYMDGPLVSMGESNYLVGFFAVIDDDLNYAKSNITAMISTEPDRITKIVIDGTNFIRLHFDKGSRLIANTYLIMDDNLVHTIYSELLALGRIPFYYQYGNVSKFFLNTRKYNGYTLGSNPVIWEYVESAMSRDPDQPDRLYRLRKNVKKDLGKVSPDIVGLNNVSRGASNVISRQGGSKFKEGLTATLVDPSDRAERMETMLRLS